MPNIWAPKARTDAINHQAIEISHMKGKWNIFSRSSCVTYDKDFVEDKSSTRGHWSILLMQKWRAINVQFYTMDCWLHNMICQVFSTITFSWACGVISPTQTELKLWMLTFSFKWCHINFSWTTTTKDCLIPYAHNTYRYSHCLIPSTWPASNF